MSEYELEQEVLNLAHALGDPDGLEYSTIEYIAQELGLKFKQTQTILNRALFDLE